jgi:hypothetical protein
MTKRFQTALRLPRNLHKLLSRVAKKQGLSNNAAIEKAINEYGTKPGHIDYLKPSDKKIRLRGEREIYEECYKVVVALEGTLRTLGYIEVLDTENPVAAVAQLHSYFCWRSPRVWNVDGKKPKKKK